MAKKDQNQGPPPNEVAPARRPQDWTAAERLRAVVDSFVLDSDELGEYLRRNGLHREQLEQSRTDAQTALETPRRQRRPAAEAKRIKELERELRHKEKALAEAAALLGLRKKLALLTFEWVLERLYDASISVGERADLARAAPP